MIDQVDQRLKDWIHATLSETDVSLAQPSDEMTGRCIGMYLMEVVRTPTARGNARRPPLQISLRYLVTSWAEDPEEAHRMLGELIFAAMEKSEFEVESDPSPVALWTAFNTAPRPSFVLRVPLRLERPQEKIPLVRKPPIIKNSPMVPLEGQILGPEGIPLKGARVEVPGLQISTSTDSRGRFAFSAVPVNPPLKRLIITFKGSEHVFSPEQPITEMAPLLIHLKELEV